MNNISDNNNHQITNGNNKYNHHDTPIENLINDKARKEVIIIGQSMLNDIKNCGVSKSKKIEVLNFPGATSKEIVRKIDDVLNQKPESLIVHVGPNDLTNGINLLNNIKKIVTKTKQKNPNTVLSFSNIIIRKDN